MANDSLLNSTKVKKLKKRKVELTDFNSGYTALISKMKRLEDMYQRNLSDLYSSPARNIILFRNN